ncbi:MAG TPA: hypothetical protein VIX81_08230 [Gammaproteobacteria bacterium]
MEAMAALFAGTGAAAGTAAAATPFITAPAVLAATGPELFYGTAAAAAASSTAIAGPLTGFAGSLGLGSFGDILSGVFDKVSIIGDVLGTASDIAQANQSAADRTLQAGQIKAQASLDELRALEELNARIAKSVVAAGAGGIAPTGSVYTGIREAQEQQEFETTVGGRDARIRAAQLQLEADAGRGSVTSLIFSGLSDIANRGDTIRARSARRG